MTNKLAVYIIISLIILLILAGISMCLGVISFEKYDFITLIKAFYSDNTELTQSERYVLYELRLPRVVMAILIGSALAVSGTCLQGMFKNPLATPDLIGVTAGATLMAAITIVLGHNLMPMMPQFIKNSILSIAAFAGSLITMFAVYSLSTVQGKTNVIIMLLSGVAISALAFATTGFFIYIAKDDQLRDLTFWNLGSLGGATWIKNLILLIVISACYVVLLPKGKALNAMMLGEKDAEHLGINVEKTKKQIVILVALMVGTCVAFSGTIGFVGLIIPYILRLVFRSNYHFILPLSAIFGSILLLIADTISRTLVAPSEIPIGILTAFMGAPIFISILAKFKKSI